jgi:hypothetical protein
MTTLCSGGASQAKPGSGPLVVMTGGALGALLNNIPTPWAVAFAALLTGVTYDLSTMCTTDPPALVTMTGADMVALVGGPVSTDYFTAVAKFYTFIKYWAWFQLCECSTVVTPAPAAAPAAPSGLPQLNPPIAPPIGSTPCLDVTARADVRNWQYNMAGAHYYDFTTALMGSLPRVPVTATITGDSTASSLPAGATGRQVTVTLSGYTDTTIPHSTIFQLVFYKADGTNTGGPGVNMLTSDGPAPQVVTYTIPADRVSVQAFAAQNAGVTGSVPFTVEVAFQCAPATVQQPCCPPDPVATGLLSQILTAVTLMQRQLVPFAYISGTAHAGLTGTGTITVQGLLGVRIDLTTIPATLVQDNSTPPFVFSAGWVSVEDANGFIDETRAHAQHQVWTPRIASDATVVGYSFVPGVVATITELQREP